MLLELNIENFAIIDKVSISFTKGLNIITGETGTGKSIIVDAIALVLGSRADKDYIRSGAEKAVIEAIFCLEQISILKNTFEQYGIPLEEDNLILISREVHVNGRSISRINGRAVTLSMLTEVTNKIINIQSQHENQSLLSKERQLELIDLLGKDVIDEVRKKVRLEYRNLSLLKNKLNRLYQNEMERQREIDLLKFQIEEIDEADLKPNEEENIVNEYNMLSNSEEISNTMINVLQELISDSYGSKGIVDRLTNLFMMLDKLEKYDKNIKSYAEIIEGVTYQIQDVARDIRKYESNIDYDHEKLIVLEKKLDLINRLKRKYGTTVEEILSYRDSINDRLQTILNLDEEIKKLKTEIIEMEKVLNDYCKQLTSERQKICKDLEKQIIKEFEELNMGETIFKANINKLDYFTDNGVDEIEFYISTNPGQPLKSLSKIASGGEMSRILLAFKSILAEIDSIPSLIFDEIDTGISGRTAQIVGEKILKISKTHQIICITHLPQIAAMADTHFLITKNISENNTSTSIKKINMEERVEEISRLIGGVSLTTTTKQHAKEMISLSQKIKK
ncbi:DNA repair protein RecN [Gottschalkia purinilytica]|uniref:DNA repair protein RecN n=1 Tax=Gottschalkia purinilytica TaxID=1503 RepID=A0A0L0W7G6_GOTPU|nr:DNA repair protein RecN [Gottschalkia purinilytica]KNF07411.1 DNA repair protein RecN [Gottschalkia purinilytica]